MPKAKEESDTEPQKHSKRQRGSQSNPFSTKRRFLQIDDSPVALKGEEGKAVGEIPFWLDSTIVGTIQQRKKDSHVGENIIDNVQILVETMKNCKNKMTTVAQHGGTYSCAEMKLSGSRRDRSGTKSRSRYWAQCTLKSLRECRS